MQDAREETQSRDIFRTYLISIMEFMTIYPKRKLFVIRENYDIKKEEKRRNIQPKENSIWKMKIIYSFFFPGRIQSISTKSACLCQGAYGGLQWDWPLIYTQQLSRFLS